ncbi:PAS domain S-box protein [Spirochaetota bacterium]
MPVRKKNKGSTKKSGKGKAVRAAAKQKSVPKKSAKKSVKPALKKKTANNRTKKKTVKPVKNEYKNMTRDDLIKDLKKLKKRIDKLEKVEITGAIEETLKKSEERYKYLAENMADIVWTLNRDFETTYVSPSIEKVLGFTPEERKTQKLLEMVTPETQQRLVARFLEELQLDSKKGIDPERNIKIEAEYYHADGHTVWMENNVKPLRNETGEIIGMYGTSRDITERRQAAEALRESEEKFRIISEQSLLGIIIIQDNMIKYYNDASVEIAGYPREEVEAWTVTDFFKTCHPDDLPVVMEQARKKQQGDNEGVVSNYSMRMITKSGETKWVDIYSKTINYEGKPADLVSVVDFTKKVKAEEELKRGEERLRSIIDSSFDGIMLADEQGHIIEWNGGLERITGLKREEVLGQKTWDIQFKIAVEDMRTPELYAQIKALMSPDTVREDLSWMGKLRRNKIQHPDGTTRFVQTMPFPFKTDAGIMIGSIVRDVTESEMAEEALKRNEERLRSIIESSFDGIVLVTEEGNVIEWNKAQERNTGLKREEVMGQKIWDIQSRLLAGDTKPSDLHEMHKNYMNMIIVQKDLSMLGKLDEREIKHIDGTNRILETMHFFFKADEETMIGSIIRDVTEREKAEEAIKKNEKRYRSIIENSFDGIVLNDEQGFIIEWNKSQERITGLKREDVMGRFVWDVQFGMLDEDMSNPEVYKRNVKKKNRVVEDGDTSWVGQMQQNHIRHPDGTIRILQTMPFMVTTEKGSMIGSIVRDVTEKVHMEEMVIQSEKMVSVGGLAAGMAHEINNPLAGILQNAQVARNRLSGDMEKNRAAAEELGIDFETISKYMDKRGITDLLNAIMESVNRAAKIVENMLSFSRKGESIQSNFDIGDLLDLTVELANSDYDLKKKYDFKQIEIIREYDQNMPSVLCEGSKLQQVFLNILKNGAEAMSDRQDKSKKAFFKFRTKRDGNIAQIEIEDNGPGMPEDVRKRIFEPFYTTKPVGLGIGLGLSVSYFIITENHKGEISVESTPGKGSKFIIRLPIKK